MALDNLSGIINSATNAVSTAKNSLSSFGPASGLSAIGDKISGALSGALGSVSESIGNIFAGSALGVVQSDKKLPMPNVLHDYASYNCLFSIGCLDANSFNFPDQSYFAGKYPPWILKSANADPNNRINTAAGKFDFYIDNVQIVGQYGFEKSTGNTNSTNLEFQIIEPYSMGLFMAAVQQSAYEQGYLNYTDAVFLLMIEFRGADQAGNMKMVPGTRKFIPFRFNNLIFKVTAGGSTYNVVATIANAVALNDTYKLVKNDVSIKGKTVQEILQTGEQSLQVVANARYKQQKEDGQVAIPDEILILFPNDISSAAGGGSSSSSKENDTPATTGSTAAQESGSGIFQKLGVTRSSSNKTLVQGAGDCNPLGRASLGFNAERPGDKPLTNVADHYDEKTKTYVRGKVVSDPKEVVMQFPQGSDIVNIINQVLIKSDASKQALDPGQLSTEGMRPWWKIDVKTYDIPSNANMKTTGQIPRLIVYRVIPYKVHASRMLPPNAPAPGITELKKQAAKEYNYIYTGKNVDILKFDIEIKNTFYNPVLADSGNRTADKKQAKAAGEDINADRPETKIEPPQGNLPTRDAQPTKMLPSMTSTSTDGKGGTRGETPANRVARMFHDSLTYGQDMMNIELEIVGDPYWIANSGKGNYVDNPTNLINVTKDGSVNYVNSEVDVVINFRTPTDINQATGLYELKNTKIVNSFSGLYRVSTIRSYFSKGTFRQVLVCHRRQGQDIKASPNAKTLYTTKETVPTSTGSGSTELRTPAEVQASKDLGDFPG
jgi:hypothetical protein